MNREWFSDKFLPKRKSGTPLPALLFAVISYPDIKGRRWLYEVETKEDLEAQMNALKGMIGRGHSGYDLTIEHAKRLKGT